MSYDITRHDLPEVTFLHRSARCEHSKVGDTLAGILPVLFQHAAQNGIQLMSPPMTVYPAWGPGTVTLQAGFAVGAGTAGGDDVQVAVLPAGPAMVAIHTGPYDGLQAAHAAIDAHIHQQGLTAGGPPREIYLTDPGEVPDPAEWKTQIVWPLSAGL